jgi:hypothetical protein
MIKLLKDEEYSEEEIEAIMELDDAEEEGAEDTTEYAPLPEGKTETDMIKEIKEAVTRQCTQPEIVAAQAISAVNHRVQIEDLTHGIKGIKGIDTDTLAGEINKHSKALASGDMSQVENMLFSMSHTLQSTFSHYLQLASATSNVNTADSLIRIALKAQNQCRQSLATLGDLKNPKRATFIKQQNNLLQQINKENSEKTICNQNKQSRLEHEQSLDRRTLQGTIQADSRVEAVGEVHRSKDTRRKKTS